MEGTPFGRYRLISLLGRGGMGEVWQAFDTATERVVALKLLPAELADDETFQQRFRREAKSAAALDEPHVVPIYDFGEIDGRLFVTMRLIKGRDLHVMIKEGRVEPVRAVKIIDQVASALQAAHQIGLVHRDVKPTNILVTDDDFAYLIDFGIARAAGQTSLTSVGSVVGTWAYMAPERLSTGSADARADIYALACVLYECLTGSQPFPGSSLEQQLGGHLTQAPPRASAVRGDLPTELDGVIAKGMAKNPDDRYSTTREMALAAMAAVTLPVTGPNSLKVTTPVNVVTARPGAGPPQRPADLVRPSQPNRPLQAPPPSGGASPPTFSAQAPFYDQHRHSPAPSGPNTLVGKPTRKGRVIVIAGVAAVLVVIAVVTAIVLSNSGGGPGTSPASPPATSDSGNPGPFTGTFAATFGPEVKWDGTPTEDSPPGYEETWRLRSECTTDACVATASPGGRYPVDDVVFDKIADRWLSVSTGTAECGNRETESWDVITLDPKADGTMTGEWSQTTANGCFQRRSVDFSRKGDTDLSRLPDPAALPARKASPAEGLRGVYRNDVAYSDGTSAPVTDYRVATECLRSGDRCMSFFMDTKSLGSKPFVFGNGLWVRHDDYDGTCGNSNTHITQTAEMALPQPPADPIPLVGGKGHSESSACSDEYTEKFTRTGD